MSWMHSFGDLAAVGVEGTGNYGAGLARFLLAEGARVVEVARPDRRARRLRGKSDTLDAENAGRAVLSREGTSVVKHRDGADDPATATRIALRSLARRILALEEEIADLDGLIAPLLERINPRLTEATCVGTEIAAQLLITAGENPERMRSEASFAMLCGVAPLPASSGKIRRYRLNRGGDRAANCALHMAAISRLRVDPRTREYAARRAAEGLSKKEILRCLKRYLARELYKLLRPAPPAAPNAA